MIIKIMSEKVNYLIEQAIKGFVFVYLIFEEVDYLLLSVLVLIVIDQITGVWKALKNKEFKWKFFNKVYAKMILYLVVLIATYVYEHFVIGVESHYFTKGLAAIIGFQELASTYLNISEITETDFLCNYIKKLKK